jgi:hypothetical protein
VFPGLLSVREVRGRRANQLVPADQSRLAVREAPAVPGIQFDREVLVARADPVGQEVRQVPEAPAGQEVQATLPSYYRLADRVVPMVPVGQEVRQVPAVLMVPMVLAARLVLAVRRCRAVLGDQAARFADRQRRPRVLLQLVIDPLDARAPL